jgi:hypothetical protein
MDRRFFRPISFLILISIFRMEVVVPAEAEDQDDIGDPEGVEDLVHIWNHGHICVYIFWVLTNIQAPIGVLYDSQAPTPILDAGDGVYHPAVPAEGVVPQKAEEGEQGAGVGALAVKAEGVIPVDGAVTGQAARPAPHC